MSDYTSQPPVNTTTTTTVKETPPALASTGYDLAEGVLLGGVIILAGIASAWIGCKLDKRK